MIKLTGKFQIGGKTSTRNFDKINAAEWTNNDGRVFLNKYLALLEQGSAIVNGKITRYTEEEVEFE